MFVDDISIPHAWYSIETDVNDKIYFQIIYSAVSYNYKITLTSQNYSGWDLATELQTQINSAFTAISDNFTVTYDNLKLAITIVSGDANCYFNVADADVLANESEASSWGTGNTWDVSDPQDINTTILKQLSDTSYVLTWTSSIIDIQPIKNVYVYCSNLSNNTTVAPDGSSGVIKKSCISYFW